MTVVVDHDTRHLVWMADGHGKDVLRSFFDALGEERAHRLTHISADGAQWIADVVAERAPNAVRAMDPFHVVAWATDALDTECREAWNRARRQAADPELARRLKDSRHTLWKNPEDLTDRQQAKLAWIAVTDPRLHRAGRRSVLGRGLRQPAEASGADGCRWCGGRSPGRRSDPRAGVWVWRRRASRTPPPHPRWCRPGSR
jgi:transposase